MLQSSSNSPNFSGYFWQSINIHQTIKIIQADVYMEEFINKFYFISVGLLEVQLVQVNLT